MKPLFFFLLLISTKLFADVSVVSGRVVDKANGTPLPFANITLSGHKGGTISNSEGYFTLGTNGANQSDSIIFSYLGYENFVLKFSEIQNEMIIYLQPVSIELAEIAVSSRTLTADEIIDSVKSNFNKNKEKGNFRKDVFVRQYHRENISKPFMAVKRLDFEGLTNNLVEEFLEHIPEENVSYQDALFKTYVAKTEAKLIPLEAYSLEEKTELNDVLRVKLDSFITGIEESLKDSTIYFKIRSGIFNTKLTYTEGEVTLSMGRKKKSKKNSNDKVVCNSDSIYYATKTDPVKWSIIGSLWNNSNINNLHFFDSYKKYRFYLEGISLFNNEPVYEISFAPKRKGLYKGTMLVTTNKFAILQMDFEFAEGKTGDKFNVLGFGMLEKYKKYKLIFSENNGLYYLKYLYLEEEKDVSIERNISILKKQKRLMGGKTLDEMKVSMDFFTHGLDIKEILIVDKEPIDSLQFQKVVQPDCVKYKKLYGYTAQMWQNNTIMQPAQELKTFKRKTGMNEAQKTSDK